MPRVVCYVPLVSATVLTYFQMWRWSSMLCYRCKFTSLYPQKYATYQEFTVLPSAFDHAFLRKGAESKEDYRSTSQHPIHHTFEFLLFQLLTFPWVIFVAIFIEASLVWSCRHVLNQVTLSKICSRCRPMSPLSAIPLIYIVILRIPYRKISLILTNPPYSHRSRSLTVGILIILAGLVIFPLQCEFVHHWSYTNYL